jgi:mono/diheme cytochrome c family protein
MTRATNPYRLVPALLLPASLLLFSCATSPPETSTDETKRGVEAQANDELAQGRKIFRSDTFGSEAFWTTTRLHDVLQGEKFGGTGPGVSPKQALDLGLKVDLAAVPKGVVEVLKVGKLTDLNDPANTVALLKADAVVGVKAFFDESGKHIEAMGITCALCHSTVDNSFAKGIGHRLDGWPNRDLNIGAIVATAPDLSAFAKLLQVDDATVRKVLNSWGPGRYDAELNLDGKAFRPDGKTSSTLIPPAYGLAGVNNHTWTGSWGTITYWNAYVANLQMHGQGTFFDPRLDDAKKYPVAARAHLGHKRDTQDLITAKLPALHYYQMSLPAPKPLAGSFDPAGAGRGKELFEGKARCATCHVPPRFTEPGWNLHKAEEIGIDDFQAKRSPDERYRTEPLRALGNSTVHKGGYYHDGRFATLRDVVGHYDRHFGTRLSEQEMNDLVEFLKSI